ncbi:hypothetical protein HanPSC8_Chr13g0593351 [Helianthus annuus]|nr:hypothetical protein HanPSC8_Chr13g0593351 [Helianthus annuus]
MKVKNISRDGRVILVITVSIHFTTTTLTSTLIIIDLIIIS